MWCTRWFLPLVILPLPTAPPYFLAIFLISQFLHARPCFYCMVLLTFLFSTSCYWEAVPIDAQLSRPMGNATTFREAILANWSLPEIPSPEHELSNSVSASRELGPIPTTMRSLTAEGGGEELKFVPPVIQLLDRCWCNVFSRSGLFEPTDVGRWEMESVEAARKGIEARVRDAIARERERNKERKEEEGVTDVEKEGRSGEGDAETDTASEAGNEGSFSFRGLRELLFPTANPASSQKYRLKPASSSLPSPRAISDSSSRTSSAPPSSDAGDDSIHPENTEFTASPTPTTMTTTQRQKLLRPYYDFRPYGLDITLDFRWDRNAHTQS